MHTIAFLGDSLTDADRYRLKPEHLGYGYVADLQIHLSNMQYRLINLGFNGYKLADLLFQLSEEQTCAQIEQANELVLYIGINDVWSAENKPDAVWEEKVSQMETLFGHIHQELLNIAPQATLKVLIPYAPFTSLKGQRYLRQLQTFLISYCQREGLDYFETAHAIQENPDLYFVSDKVHYSPEGAKQLAQALWQWLITNYH